MAEEARILCVDDERNVLKALERVFLDDDYEILTAESGEEGLALLAEGAEVQIVISDYRMPGMCGVDFLREVYRRWPDTVRIVLSGYADTGAVVAAINEGHIYKFIAKPWNDDELRVAIGNAVERHALKKSNRELMADLRAKNEELARINYDLEAIVAERTAEVVFQNRVLVRAQNILDALPMGVVGIDMEGAVVQANEEFLGLLGREGKGGLGFRRDRVLPAVMNAFVDGLLRDGVAAGMVCHGGKELFVKGVVMKRPGQEGIVLAVDERGTDGRQGPVRR